MPHGATYGWERGFVIDYGQKKAEDSTYHPSEKKPKKITRNPTTLTKTGRKQLAKKLFREAPGFFSKAPRNANPNELARKYAKKHGAEYTELTDGSAAVWIPGSELHLEATSTKNGIVLKKTHGNNVHTICHASDLNPRWILPDAKKKPPQQEDWLYTALNAANIEYVDMRHKGGALWAIGGEELKLVMARLERNGAKFRFVERGGKATCYKPAWFIKGYPKFISEGKTTQLGSKNNAAKQRVETSRLARIEATGVGQQEKPKTCSNCANLGGPKCTHGGFALCSDWSPTMDKPDYWPEMRKGGAGWGSPQKMESDYVSQRDIKVVSQKLV